MPTEVHRISLSIRLDRIWMNRFQSRLLVRLWSAIDELDRIWWGWYGFHPYFPRLKGFDRILPSFDIVNWVLMGLHWDNVNFYGFFLLQRKEATVLERFAGFFDDIKNRLNLCIDLTPELDRFPFWLAGEIKTLENWTRVRVSRSLVRFPFVFRYRVLPSFPTQDWLGVRLSLSRNSMLLGFYPVLLSCIELWLDITWIQ